MKAVGVCRAGSGNYRIGLGSFFILGNKADQDSWSMFKGFRS